MNTAYDSHTSPWSSHPPTGRGDMVGMGAGLCFPQEVGKRERPHSVLISQQTGSHILSVQLDAGPPWSPVRSGRNVLGPARGVMAAKLPGG